MEPLDCSISGARIVVGDCCFSFGSASVTIFEQPDFRFASFLVNLSRQKNEDYYNEKCKFRCFSYFNNTNRTKEGFDLGLGHTFRKTRNKHAVVHNNTVISNGSWCSSTLSTKHKLKIKCRYSQLK